MAFDSFRESQPIPDPRRGWRPGFVTMAAILGIALAGVKYGPTLAHKIERYRQGVAESNESHRIGMCILALQRGERDPSCD